MFPKNGLQLIKRNQLKIKETKMDLLTFEKTLKEYFPKLTWKYIKDGAAGADLPIAPDDRTRFTDPSLSIAIPMENGLQPSTSTTA